MVSLILPSHTCTEGLGMRLVGGYMFIHLAMV